MSYKLYYFNTHGRAEMIRYLFADSGQKYEDIRLASEEWKKFKPKTPMGQLPVLEYDGKMLAQSFAIFRLVANKLGYAEGDCWEKAEMDSFVDLTWDIALPAVKAHRETDPEKKATMKKDFTENIFKEYMPYFERALQGKEYLVGSKVTWADFALFNLTSNLEEKDYKLDDYPQCVAHKERIAKRPNIAKWIAERPVSSF